MTLEYDEATCITAGELRAAGCSIQEDVPDCAWVPRSALKYGEFKIDRERSNASELHGSVTVDVLVPWRWVDFEVKVEAAR